MKKLIKKTVIRALIFCVVGAILAAVDSSAVLTNNIALGQLENSDATFVLMNFIQNIRPIITTLYIIFAVLIFWPVVVDTYKLIKNKYSKEEEK